MFVLCFNVSYFLTSTNTMITKEIQRIDRLLDQKVQRVQSLLKNKKSLDYSLINNDLVYLYNEMLTLSYSLKLWLLNGLPTVSEQPEVLLKLVKTQFEKILNLMNQHKLLTVDKTYSVYCIQSYQQLNQAI